jgi:hypothetical protein
MYSYNETYDFNISGLNDEDNKFNIYMSSVNTQVSPDWYYPDWFYSIKIKIAASKVEEDFYNFPVLIQLYQIYEAQDDGSDILFTNATGFKLNHEIESYIKTSGNLIAWVNIPVLYCAQETILYMYYGNPLCGDQQNVTQTWNDDFTMVQHLEESLDVSYDSTSNNNDGIAFTSLDSFTASGKIDGAIIFDNSTEEYITIKDADELSGRGKDFTVEIWFKPNNILERQHIISKCIDDINKDYYLEIYSSKLRVAYEDFGNNWDDTVSNGLGKTTLAVDTWYYGAFTFNHSSKKLTLYLNGNEEGSWILPSDLPDTSEPLSIARKGGDHPNLYYNGTIDEIRILNTEKKDKWIKTSYNSMSYSFYSFESAKRIDGAPVLSNVEIYKLDPSKSTQRFSPEIITYGMVYKQNLCGQSFIPSFTGYDNLMKVYLYLGKKGLITDAITVSIYDDNSGSPNTKLRSASISADSILTSMSWVECNFSSNPVELSGGSTYHIVLNTSGGEDAFNCYTWFINESNCYSGTARISSNGGNSWGYLTDTSLYDFYRRIVYETNQPPYTPKITGYFYGLSGILNTFFVTNNTNGPHYSNSLYYRSDWGDGKDTGWMGPYDYSEYCAICHRWIKPGTYRWIVQVKDEYGNENEIDNVNIIKILEGFVLPEDLASDEPLQGLIIGDVLSFSESLNGTMLMNLYSHSFSDKVPFGRILVFPLGSVTYTVPYTIGVQKTIFQNGGIISDGPAGYSLKKEPSFFETEDALAFRIIQVKGIYSTVGGGAGNYKLQLNMRSSINREFSLYTTNLLGLNPGGAIYNFKMQIYGDNDDVWLDYFTNAYNFMKLSDRPDTLLYKKNGKAFILDSSLVEISLEGIR